MIDLTKLVTSEMKATQKLKQEQEAAIAANRKYLAATDWLVIRKQETGVAIPADILVLRQAARDALPTGA